MRKFEEITLDEAFRCFEILYPPPFTVHPTGWKRVWYSERGMDGNGFFLVHPFNQFSMDFDLDYQNITLLSGENEDPEPCYLFCYKELFDYFELTGIEIDTTKNIVK